MMEVRKAADRGHFDHGWLDTRHTFSFADYHDPNFMGFSDLRVINEDIVQPGMGFGTHGHRDMEIVTWVLEGGLQHHDSMGNGSVIRPGSVQRMTAGTGVRHSEFNASKDELVHFLQIWILPEAARLEPGYEEKRLSGLDGSGFHLVGSRDGRDGSITIHQDVSLYAAMLAPSASARQELAPGRSAWLQIARGSARVNGLTLEQGDGVAMTGEAAIDVSAGSEGAEILLFDLR
ncbi:MAG: pirin family protein [Thermoanaerobaculia bacterium]|nr:pirin family protein [Thermoanaerobaculia bacterium]